MKLNFKWFEIEKKKWNLQKNISWILEKRDSCWGLESNNDSDRALWYCWHFQKVAQKTTQRRIAKHWLHSRFVQCFTKGQGQNSHFLQCFKIQRKVTSLLLFLDCVSLKFFTQPIAPECNSLVTDLKNLISGLVWIPLEYQDVLHKTSQVLPN